MFELLNGWLALGTLGGAIPIIIHLLNRRRFKQTRWGAMEYLLAALKKNYRRVKMENLLLLLLRVLMMILLALALARPRIAQSGLLGGLGIESRHVIILLDNSLSTGYREGTANIFAQAQAYAQQVLAPEGGFGKGDVVTLLLMSDIVKPLIAEATLDNELVRQEVGQLRPGWGSTDIAKALAAAAEKIGTTKKSRKEIFLITDMQANAWPSESERESDEFRRTIEKIKQEANLYVVNAGAVASNNPENVAVTSLVPTSRLISTGTPSEFKAEITNFGGTKKAGVQVNFLVDNFNQNSEVIDIEPGKSVTVTFNHTFKSSGGHVVKIQLSEDKLAADNTRWLAVNVEEAVAVLLVNGEPGTQIEDNETYFLERALKPPTEERDRKLSPVEPEVMTEFGVSAVNFEKYRMVVLANVASLAAENIVARLEEYVRQGGALVVFLGERIDTAFYNDRLYKEGKGLLPSQIKKQAEAGENGVRLVLTKPHHRIFEWFSGDNEHFVNKFVIFKKWFDLEEPPNKEALIAARFDSGTPAIVEHTYGRGKVVLFASTCDADWNTFPKQPAFIVLVHDLLGHMAAGDIDLRNITVNHDYSRIYPAEAAIESITVKAPGSTLETTLRPNQVEDKEAGTAYSEIIINETATAGPYELIVNNNDGFKRTEFIAVNANPKESDLARIAQDEVKTALNGLEIKFVNGVQELQVAMTEGQGGRDFTRALLIAMLAIMCVELILGQRFGR